MNRNRLYVGGILLTLVIAASAGLEAGTNVPLPDPAMDDALSAGGPSTLVLAGGCFWGVEEVYQHVRGVLSATTGYAGGAARTAKYDMVSSGTTGHAESVRVTYDPSKISVGQLLKIFFAVAHDPTERGGQGPDIGPQYRSVIFYAGDRQRELAQAYIDQLRAARVFGKEITTQLTPLAGFYEAEAYHQDYAARNPTAPYIVRFDLPKVDELRKQFRQMYVK